MMPSVETVLGPVPIESLGLILPHEHFPCFRGVSEALEPPAGYLLELERLEREAIREVQAYGVGTFTEVTPIGTMRAIGAQRIFVLGMVCFETLLLGLGFGTAGMLGGSAIISALNKKGIPASTEQLRFFFGGPALHPTLSQENLILAFCIVLAVSLISTLYPAAIATRVSPVLAMSSDE
jgi:hypothetical protein